MNSRQFYGRKLETIGGLALDMFLKYFVLNLGLEFELIILVLLGLEHGTKSSGILAFVQFGMHHYFARTQKII